MSTAFSASSAQRVAQALVEADRHRRAGQAQEAERLCRQLLAAEPDSPPALNFLALLRRDQGDLGEAEALLRRAVALAPKEAALFNNLGNLQRRRGDIPGAEYSLRTAISLNAAYPEAHYNLGLVLQSAGFPDLALDSHRRAATLNPRYVEAHVQIAALLRERGEAEDALKALDLALRANARSFEAHYYRGCALADLDRYEEAIDAFKTALAIAPNEGVALHALGNAHAALGRTEEAIAHYRRALAAKPELLDAHRDLNALLWDLDRSDEALQSYAVARGSVGETPDLLLAEANHRIRLEQTEMAETLLRRARQAAPERIDVGNALARALTMQRKFDEGVKLLEDLMKAAPNAIYNHRDAAIAYLQMGEPREAARRLEEALAISPFDQLHLAHLALAWREMGDSRLDRLMDVNALVTVYEVEPPPGFADIESFNRALSEDLRRLHNRRREPIDQTLRGGTQTLGYLFDRHTRALDAVQERIREAVADYVRKLPDDPTHPVSARRNETFDFATAWSCQLRSSGYHTNHVHPMGWISSAYYAALPDVVSEGSGQQGWIKFGESNLGLGERDRPGRTVKPAVGKLVLFPSYFWHGTIPFVSDSSRLTIAFDIVPGTIKNRSNPSAY
ncbi:MAG TPA: tetratricopeptide repeat protein [Rhizomicrobium sp.]|jgi:tetratricopeptide (TPR) repeat protein|nr:tetratricopeptide repeat protein [Rhizomicrobium sp.]